MHHRHTSFIDLGRLVSDDPSVHDQDFRFTGADVRWFFSPLGYLGLSAALAGAGERRSWALTSDDRGTVASDAGLPAPIVNAPESFSRDTTRVFSAANSGVSPVENPEDDSRGVQAVRIQGRRFTTPLGDLELARSRDGFWFSLELPGDAAVYGLGEKTGGLDKRGRTWVMWNSDDPEHMPGTDPLYQSIPVAYLVTPEKTVTLFVDSPATIYIDVGEADPDRIQFEVYDERFELYWAEDDSLPAAVERYTRLTGRTPLPPEWALGFQQCRYSYFPATRVREVAERMRAAEIPCDVLYLDIHYMDGYRVFTWDAERFPDPKDLTQVLRRDGFRLVTILDPGVKRDPSYPVYAQGLAGDRFLKQADGTVYTGRVWPGEAVFPDFFTGVDRQWWAEHHRALFDAGVAGIWNDMNEPADFSGDELNRRDFTVPDSLISKNDGTPRPIGVLHNAYASGMNEATRAAFTRFRPEERGFILTRAGYAGIQRHAAVWTGDNYSWWEHLALLVPMLANLGLSGVAFAGGDAGGFQQNADGELYVRWIAAASLMPFFRSHSALDSSDHEPWSFGEEVLSIARRSIGLRYRLLPYLYTLFEEASRTGAPVLRPLVWEYPDDPRVRNRSDSFLLGSALLVAPIRERGVQERSVYLPAGRWYDFHTGAAIDSPAAGSAHLAAAPLDTLPLYLRGGSILPFESLRQHTGEAGDGVLRLLVAPDTAGSARGTVYADAGEGFAYRDGEYLRLDARLDPTGIIELVVVNGTDHIRWRELELIRVVPHEEGVLAIAPTVRRELPRTTGERITLEL